jgi:hypothetical protein
MQKFLSGGGALGSRLATIRARDVSQHSLRRNEHHGKPRSRRVRRGIGVGAALSSVWLAGCVLVPPLQVDGISIAEIVQRVKCEIAFAVPKPSGPWPTGPYQWMSGWSAKVDLTLRTDATSSITPTAVFTKYFPFEKVTEVGGNVLRFFTLGVGGGLSTSANRTEILSFTISLAELQEFKKRNECNLPWGIDVYGNLGLQEWISSALTPVESQQLTVGIHPPPGGKSLPAPKPEADKAVTEAVEPDPLGAMIDALKVLRDNARNDAQAAVDSAEAAKQHAKMLNIAATYKDATKVNKFVNMTAAEVDKAKHKALEADELALKYPTHPRIKEIDILRKTATLAGEDADAAKKSVEGLLETLPHDPPVDSLSHSVQFVVAVSGNITPNWTLVHFKGPTASGSPLAAGGLTATHTLTIAMGSPAVAAGPPPGAGPEQNRQLNNMVIIQNLGQPRPLQ